MGDMTVQEIWES